MLEVGKSHRFGGKWTDDKLEVLSKYLAAYTTALSRKNFRKAYIDAFAGTGYREVRTKADGQHDLLFPDLADPDPQGLLDGSARLALRIRPVFDKYIFIEKSPSRCATLDLLKREFPEKADVIEVRQGDANLEIRDLCRKDWKYHRAVLFLDPYGMQVEWKTIEAIAGTKAIDLWLLFPLGIGVVRLLKKDGDIPKEWRERLNVFLGTEDWYDEFYNVRTEKDLFGNEVEYIQKATVDTIGRYFVNRLKGVFAGVAEQPGVLKNSSNNPLYLLCFAVGNEKGKGPALKIANYLLKELHKWQLALP